MSRSIHVRAFRREYPYVMIVTFYLKMDATRSPLTGKVTNIRATGITQSVPLSVSGNSILLRMNLEIPDTAFDPVELNIKFNDNPAPSKKVVADLQKWVADLSDPS